MKLRTLFSLWILALLLSACSPSTATPNPGGTNLTATRTPAQATPLVHTTSVPEVRTVAQTYLDAWVAEDYTTMYAMLTPASQDATTEEAFTKRHKDVAVNTTLKTIHTEILSTLTNVSSAQAAYRVILETNLLGNITRDTSMNLSLEKNEWRVQWEEGMILPELRGGNQLVLDYKIPARGNIYARDGYPIATTADAVALGIIPSQFEDGGESAVLSELSRLTGIPSDWIKGLYGDNYPDKFIPVGETTLDEFNARADVVSNLPGVQWKTYRSRYYSDSGLAPHVAGYMLSIFPEELEQYQRSGYRGDESVGKRGLEKWGEKYLTGTKGVSLYVTDPAGNVVTRLSLTDPKPAYSLTTTIDPQLQLEAQRALNGFTGAIVVLERDTGRVLAMVSSPTFDPNYFIPENLNNAGLGDVLNNPGNSLVNRAAESGYPLGSVFKIVSTATALETGVFAPDDTYECGSYYTELPGYTLKDWTVDHKLPPSGKLTLLEGLMRSCNPWFYHIGFKLAEAGVANKLSEMARAFGLGVPTGIEQIAEFEGNMPNVESQEQAVFMAIGQDKIQVTPLQVAGMIAAVGNGGTLYRPQLIEKITDPDGKAIYTFKAIERNKLPIQPQNLTYIQETLRRVVVDTRGTAVRAFTGLSIPVYGKTGTAETGIEGHPHAWFAAYTDAKREGKSDIAIAVIAEYQGEGSEFAAPITRRIVEIYFLGQPQRIYPWEARLNVTRTPTPSDDETPVPPSNGGSSSSGDNTSSGSTDSSPTPGFFIATATP
jgi:penicillin-binding protein 2